MKKTIQILVIIALGIGIAYQTYVFLRDDEKQKSMIPDISLVLLDQSKKSLKELGDGRETIVFIFRSNCNFCIKETKEINEKLNELSKAEIVFLSFENVDVIKQYKQTYLPSKRKNVTFAHADQNEVTSILENELVFPYLIWYDSEGSQLIQHRGQFPVDQIIKVLNQ